MTDEASPPPDPGAVADLESVLAGTVTIIGGVSKDQAHLPTPCPGFDVAQLVDHVVGWAGSFAARLGGREPGVDPETFRVGPDPRGQLEGFAAEIVRGYRQNSPGAQHLPIGVLLMDLQAHGWDLAIATGQQAPFGEREAATALAAGRQMLKPEYRGADKAFGPEVAAAEGATALEQLVAFLGRDPSWMPPAR